MIQVKNLVKAYGDFKLDLSMEVLEGRITGLVGKNGAGKSTTIKAILGLIRPDSGEVQVLGEQAFSLSVAEKERMGVALSDSGWMASMVISSILAVAKGNLEVIAEAWAEELILWLVFFAIITAMIPIQLKYGVEKSRIVLLVLGGAVFGLSALGSSLQAGETITVFRVIQALPDLVMVVGFLALSLCVLAAMYVWSVKILEKKIF